MNRLVGILVGVALLHATYAGAQPSPDEGRGDSTDKASPGGPKIPVSMGGDTEVMGAEQYGVSAPAAPVSVEQPIDPEAYICGPGDVFELNFWGQQNFRLRIAVDLEGRTFISKVGFVTISGKSLAAARKLIKAKVRGNYPGLQFDLALAAPRKFQVHVVENVKQPGIYTTTPLERVSTVLSRAGGITGSRRRITIRHSTGTESKADLTAYEITGDTASNPYLLDGDVISVPNPETVVTITGAVRRPGTYELVKTKDVSEVLQLAGGFTAAFTPSLPLRVIRRDEKAHETIREVTVSNEGTSKESLRDDDKVVVPTADELQRSVLIIGAVVGADSIDQATTSRRLPFIEGDTVRSLLERAGGVRAQGDLRSAYISRPQVGKNPVLLPIDLDALIVRRDFSVDKRVELGDTIVVPPMQYSVLVEGAVSRAGLYNYNPLFGIQEYLARAGGRTRTAMDLHSVKLIDGTGTMRSFDGRLKPNPGDTILVPERNFTRAEIVQIVMAGAGLLLSGVAITIAATR